MTQPLPYLDFDLLIENGGRQMHLSGSGSRLAATFPTLRSLFHFLPVYWSFRKQVPHVAELQVRWRRLRFLVK